MEIVEAPAVECAAVETVADMVAVIVVVALVVANAESAFQTDRKVLRVAAGTLLPGCAVCFATGDFAVSGERIHLHHRSHRR